jgi:hypothetical protein
VVLLIPTLSPIGMRVHNLEVPVGNVFYNHGIAVITNVDYICFIETAPVARNTYINLLNTQEEKTILTLTR